MTNVPHPPQDHDFEMPWEQDLKEQLEAEKHPHAASRQAAEAEGVAPLPEEEKELPPHREERRRDANQWTRIIGAISVAFWSLFVAVLFMVHAAKPDDDNLYARVFNYNMGRGGWDASLVGNAMALLVVGVILAMTGLGLSASRQHRRNDHLNRLMIAGLGLSFILGWVLMGIL